MIYTIPTKRGLGIELWGTYDDLRSLYDIISKFWNQEGYLKNKGFSNRDELISGFSYELRKSYEGDRLKRESSHFSHRQDEYFGCQFSWVQLLFSLTALRYNMRFFESSKLDISIFLQLEYWIENSMERYDEVGSKPLKYFINDGIHAANDFIYQFMRSINYDYFLLGGGKKAFRKLPQLLNRAVLFSEDYKKYLDFLTQEALSLKCEISELEINDDNFDYERVQW